MTSPTSAALLLLLAAYLLGSLSGSLLLGRLRGVDIRTQGSGNAGGTNAFRTQGWAFALGTVLIALLEVVYVIEWPVTFILLNADPGYLTAPTEDYGPSLSSLENYKKTQKPAPVPEGWTPPQPPAPPVLPPMAPRP